MSASLVGSEMCIRDSSTSARHATLFECANVHRTSGDCDSLRRKAAKVAAGRVPTGRTRAARRNRRWRKKG
eukprot:9922614-Alexandrium_andersonii.AAC.1